MRLPLQMDCEAYEDMAMNTIAEGKDAVLHFLENQALGRTNELPGIYCLIRDNAGQLVLFIEGHTFIGSGQVSFGQNVLDVVDGIATAIKKPS